MIVLDTNVVSELMKPAPSRPVTAWAAAQPGQSLFTTSVTEAEILYGIALLPSGRRRRAIEVAARAMFREDFAARVLPFGSDAASIYATIAAERRRMGHPISHFDAQIAAIARSAGASVATRNTDDFRGCGVQLVDPWQAVRADLERP
jgi:predicted nucleic acid-binding protein